MSENKPVKTTKGLHPARAQNLLASLQAEIDSKRLPGAVVMVVQNGQTVMFESLGIQNPNHDMELQTATPVPAAMAKNSIFRIYSMTKPIVSVAILMLVEQGKLLLTDRVEKYLPEFSNQKIGIDSSTLKKAHNSSTIHDLLRHTSGLTYEFLGNSMAQKAYRTARIGTSLCDINNTEFSQLLAAQPLQFEPGSVWEYSRSTDILGALVERISGKTLGQFLHDNVFSPLQMTDTGFSVPIDQQHRIAEPFKYDPDGGVQLRVINIKTPPKFESGGGGLVSTAADYAQFLQMLLNGGQLHGHRLLSRHTVALMTADHLGNIPIHAIPSTQALLPAGHGFGLGVAVRLQTGIAALPGTVGMYYWGGIAGTTFVVDPTLDLFAILMIQAPNQREYYRPLFRNLLYAALD